MRKIFHLDEIGQEVYSGLQHPVHSPGYLFDQPGTGRAPHAFDSEGELPGQILFALKGACQVQKTRFRLHGLSFGQVFLIPWNNARGETCLVDFGISEIAGRAFRVVEDYLEYGLTAKAAKAKLLPVNHLPKARPSDG